MDLRSIEVSFRLNLRSSNNIINLATLLVSLPRAIRSRRNHQTRALPVNDDIPYPNQETSRDQLHTAIHLPDGRLMPLRASQGPSIV